MIVSKAGRWAAANGIIMSALTLAEFSGMLHFGLVFSYGWHKLLHLLGVVMLMGNMIVGPVWFSFAYYSGDNQLLRFAGRLLQVTDLWLTIPGVLLTVLNGLCLASVFGGSNAQGWLYWSVLALFLMWALSIPVLYIQEKLYRALDAENWDRSKIQQLVTQWAIWGTLVMLPPTLIFYWMVMKNIP